MLWLAYANAAAPEPPTLATRLKAGLVAGVEDQGHVRILKVRLFSAIVAMPVAELDALLGGGVPVPVGLLETREHGRLRISCQTDACVAAAGDTAVVIRLLDRDEARRPRGSAARRPST